MDLQESSLRLLYPESAADLSAWLVFAGSPPQLTTGDLPSAAAIALQNPPNQTSHVFTAAMFPIEASKSYRVSLKARSRGERKGLAYLAIAWYDKDKRLLEANAPSPGGAGNPLGWGNGTYSYFGLVAQAPPLVWTRFTQTFGLNEPAAVPKAARYARIGALLNYNSEPQVVTQLSELELIRKPRAHVDVEISQFHYMYSHISQAAVASNHWIAQQAIIDRSGGRELLLAFHRALAAHER